MKPTPLALALAALPAVVAAQTAAPAEPSRLWWMWVAVALVIVAALFGIMMGRPRRGPTR